MGDASNFVIRRSDRHEIMLPIRLRVHEENQRNIKLSLRSGHRDGWVNADLVDLAHGGIGLMSRVYFPRGCRLSIEVLPFAEDQSGPVLEASGRVRRIVMTDRRPAYLVGLVFVDLTEAQSSQLSGLLARVNGDAGVINGEGGHVRDE